MISRPYRSHIFTPTSDPHHHTPPSERSATSASESQSLPSYSAGARPPSYNDQLNTASNILSNQRQRHRGLKRVGDKLRQGFDAVMNRVRRLRVRRQRIDPAQSKHNASIMHILSLTQSQRTNTVIVSPLSNGKISVCHRRRG